MNEYIVAFLLFGGLFGLCTYTRRHHFSEGSTTPAGAQRGGFMESRWLWTAQSAFLWPLLMLSGAYGLVRRRLARRR